MGEHITSKGLTIPDLSPPNADGENVDSGPKGNHSKTFIKLTLSGGRPQAGNSHRLHFLIFNKKGIKKLIKQALLRLSPSASRCCRLPRPPPTAKGITGGAPGNVVKPMGNNGFPRPRASCPSSAQSRNSHCQHVLMIAQKTANLIKTHTFAIIPVLPSAFRHCL